MKEIKNQKYKLVILFLFDKSVLYALKNVMCFDKILRQFDIFLFFIIEIDVSNFE